MLRKELYIGVLVAIFCFGLVGTSMAVEFIYDGSEAGSDGFTFDAPGNEISDAARNYVYDEESLVQAATEAGNWEYKWDAPETNADIAARNYNYDQESLVLGGTEAGNHQFSFYDSETTVDGVVPNEAIADDSKTKGPVCDRC